MPSKAEMFLTSKEIGAFLLASGDLTQLFRASDWRMVKIRCAAGCKSLAGFLSNTQELHKYLFAVLSIFRRGIYYSIK